MDGDAIIINKNINICNTKRRRLEPNQFTYPGVAVDANESEAKYSCESGLKQVGDESADTEYLWMPAIRFKPFQPIHCLPKPSIPSHIMPVWLWMSKRNYIAYLRYQMKFTAEAARWEWTKN